MTLASGSDPSSGQLREKLQARIEELRRERKAAEEKKQRAKAAKDWRKQASGRLKRPAPGKTCASLCWCPGVCYTSVLSLCRCRPRLLVTWVLGVRDPSGDGAAQQPTASPTKKQKQSALASPAVEDAASLTFGRLELGAGKLPCALPEVWGGHLGECSKTSWFGSKIMHALISRRACPAEGRKRGGGAKKKQALSKAELLEAARAKAEERAATEGTRQGRVRSPSV